MRMAADRALVNNDMNFPLQICWMAPGGSPRAYSSGVPYRSIPKPAPIEVSSLLAAPPMLNDARSPICFE